MDYQNEFKNDFSENTLHATDTESKKMVYQDNSTCYKPDLGFGFIFSSNFLTDAVHVFRYHKIISF